MTDYANLVQTQVLGLTSKLGTLLLDVTLHQTTSTYDAATGTKSMVDVNVNMKAVVTDSVNTSTSSPASRAPNLKLGLSQSHVMALMVLQNIAQVNVIVKDEMTVNSLRYKIREVNPIIVGLNTVAFNVGLGR